MNASINASVGGDAMTVNSDSARQICDFLTFFALVGLHGSHSAWIQRHAAELEIGLRLLQPPHTEPSEAQHVLDPVVGRFSAEPKNWVQPVKKGRQ